MRLSDLAPEEIAGTALLLFALAVAALRPGPIGELFEPPYATPAPGGGPARQIVPERSPATLQFQRDLRRP